MASNNSDFSRPDADARTGKADQHQQPTSRLPAAAGRSLGRGLRRGLLAALAAAVAMAATFTPTGTADHMEPRIPSDPAAAAGELWGMDAVNAPQAWGTATGSGRTTVAVVDTGVDYTHEDLYLNIWINQGEIPANTVDVDGDGVVTFYDLNHPDGTPVVDHNGNGYVDGGDLLVAWSDGADSDANGYVDDIIGWDFLNNDNDPIDDVFHGTHVAGTIGAVGDNGRGVAGVNWRVQIMALRNDTWSFASMAEALRYAVNNGAAISNHSYGVSSQPDADGVTPDVFEAAIAEAEAQGHIVVTSAGNGEDFPADPMEVMAIGNNTDFDIRYPASVRQPNLVAVAAVDHAGKLTHFSNYGRETVDLAAPGFEIVSTTPSYETDAMRRMALPVAYGTLSGTSMAAPHVAGALALVWDLHPEWSYTQVIAAVMGSVTPAADLEQRTTSGGTLNLGAAVAAN